MPWIPRFHSGSTPSGPITEFPITTFRLAGHNMPVAAAAIFASLAYALHPPRIEASAQGRDAHRGLPSSPWEVDPRAAAAAGPAELSAAALHQPVPRDVRALRRYPGRNLPRFPQKQIANWQRILTSMTSSNTKQDEAQQVAEISGPGFRRARRYLHRQEEPSRAAISMDRWLRRDIYQRFRLGHAPGGRCPWNESVRYRLRFRPLRRLVWPSAALK